MPFEGMNFGLANPTVKLEMPQESMAKAMQFQQLQQQTEAGKLDLQQKRQAQEDEVQARQVFQSVNGDPEAALKVFRGSGNYKMADNLEKGIQARRDAKLKFESDRAKLNETDLKTERAHIESTGNGASSIAQIKDPQERYVAYDQFLENRAAELATPIEGESDYMRQKKAKMVAGINQERVGLGDMAGPEDLDKRIKSHIDTAKTQLQWTAEGKPEKVPLTPHAGTLNGRPGFFQLDENGEVPPGWQPIPQAAITIDNRNKAAEAAGGIQANPLYAQAKSISDLKQVLPLRQGKDAANLNAMIAKIRQEEGKPPYDANQWTKVKRSNEYFSGNGKAAVTLTSNDVLYGHADEVLESLQGAGLNDTRVLNTLNQWYAKQTGKDANFKTLKVASKVFGAELGAMLGEKDAEERKNTQALFESVDSPQSFIAAVEQSKKMAATRSAGLANQYYRETGLDPVEAGILPERVAKGAVNSVAAKGYKWAEKYRTGGEGEGKPATGTPDIASIGTNTRFPKAAWTKDGPDGPGWYEKHGTNVRKVE